MIRKLFLMRKLISIAKLFHVDSQKINCFDCVSGGLFKCQA